MRIDKNTAIKCNNVEEVKDCFTKLNELGFDFEDNFDFEDKIIVYYSIYEKAFLNNVHFYISKDHNYISYKYFLKLYNKQIKEKKEPDLLVDKNGKVLKVNNWNSDRQLYWNNNIVTSPLNEWIEDSKNCFYEDDYYITKETCEKAQKRKEIENKLRLLAFELNGNRDITEEEWKNHFIKKCYLYYNYYNNTIRTGDDNVCINQGSIYCLSKDFKDKAIDLIGEKDLKDYVMNC